MAYQLVYNKDFKNQVNRLPGHLRAILRRQIADLLDNPRPARSKELEGHPNYYRIWLDGQHRLIWHVVDDEITIYLHYVGLKYPGLYQQLGFGRTEDD